MIKELKNTIAEELVNLGYRVEFADQLDFNNSYIIVCCERRKKMINLVTNCDTCIHKIICKYKDNAKADMNKLKNMDYGTGPNNNYDWETICNSRHVNIAFSCSDYKNGQTEIERR